MQESIVLAISSAEEFVKKMLNVATVYVFRTYGVNCKVFSMFLLSPGRVLKEPSSVCIYASSRGELTYVTSLSLENLTRTVRSSRRDVVIALDMYNPPCTVTVRFLCYLSDLVDLEVRELEFACSFEIYEEVSDDEYAYMIYSSRDIDPKTIARIVITMILMKLYLENKIDKETIDKMASEMREKLRIL
ncbi:MAG: hypothetical protein GXO10_03130 [Crenarchaeota archaeon]|nr:hypothetical protein [Thermoproteota archaeon]